MMKPMARCAHMTSIESTRGNEARANFSPSGLRLRGRVGENTTSERTSGLDKFISVLTYAQQSRERSNYEQDALSEKMQHYKRQVDRESKLSSNGSNSSPNGDGIQAIGRSSHKMIDAVMQSAARGKVQTIRQGYLSKRSSSLRGDWKRRFFVLDSRGMLYYYRKQSGKSSVSKDVEQFQTYMEIFLYL
ncbi:ADP-ribosylation factor GTPase-activating protein agd3 [Orobanche minor]